MIVILDHPRRVEAVGELVTSVVHFVFVGLFNQDILELLRCQAPLVQLGIIAEGRAGIWRLPPQNYYVCSGGRHFPQMNFLPLMHLADYLVGVENVIIGRGQLIIDRQRVLLRVSVLRRPVLCDEIPKPATFVGLDFTGAERISHVVFKVGAAGFGQGDGMVGESLFQNFESFLCVDLFYV